MRTANLAIVFTDIAGFTERTARQTHEENRRLLRAHEALLKPVFHAFGGRVIKAIGDAFLVVFSSPTDAVLCGAALQDRLWEWNKQAVEGLRLDVRVAINVGEVRLERGDVFGAPVNIASRVEALARSGEVLFTEAVWRSVEPARLPAVDHGNHDLRGVPAPIRLFALERSADPREPPYRGLGRKDFGPLPEISEAAERRLLMQRVRAAATIGAVSLLAIVFGGGSLTATPPEAAAARSTSSPPEPQPAQVAQLDRFIAGGPSTAVQPPLLPPGMARVAASEARASPEPSATVTKRKNPRRRDARQARLVATATPRAVPRVEHAPRVVTREAQVAFRTGESAEARRDWSAATKQYEVAARIGDNRASDKLLHLLLGPKCEARVQAAHALGRLGAVSAIPKLRELLASEDLPHEGSALTIFECSSKRAARDALRKLEAHAGR